MLQHACCNTHCCLDAASLYVKDQPPCPCKECAELPIGMQHRNKKGTQPDTSSMHEWLLAIQSFRIDAWLLAMQSFRITSDLTQWLWQVVNVRQLPPDTDSFSNNIHDFRRATDAAIPAALHKYLRVVNNGAGVGSGDLSPAGGRAENFGQTALCHLDSQTRRDFQLVQGPPGIIVQHTSVRCVRHDRQISCHETAVTPLKY